MAVLEAVIGVIGMVGTAILVGVIGAFILAASPFLLAEWLLPAPFNVLAMVLMLALFTLVLAQGIVWTWPMHGKKGQ